MNVPQSSPGSRLDNFVDRYAARTAGMTASEVRALFAVASRPEVVSLAGGMPNINALPLDAVADTVARLVAERGTVALQYGSGQGDEKLRTQICEVMRLEGIEAHPDDVTVTVGSQHALDLVTRVFIDPGDVILAEAPSYVGALSTFASYQADVVHVGMDEDGLVPEHLDNAIAAVHKSGKRAKFLYTIPNFHNPMGVCLAPERRARILEVCRRHDLLIIEDNPYGLLGFDGEPMRALRADEADGVVYLGSFSKTFAPGLRVGWAVAPHAVREKLVLAAEASVLSPPVFSQMTVSAYLETQPWRAQIKTYREMYRERRDAMLDALKTHMPPGTTWTDPAGGFFVWVTLPEGLDAKAMLPRAVTARVAYVPGTAFYADGFGASSMRLSFCYPTPDRIREGVRRLASVIAQELELRTMFGTPPGRSLPGADSPTSQAPSPDLA
ncbi:PLP-dependent aminotransferase family protein [Yinghuangia sp. ASG 101]|uniref:aminotransferase-like domain-containing protein n=1 Tax=Yinghuangia sp. ASG 101 TaxID=2896848 RepID=UPI001E311939|nr:PLP-dependent aminotransferase family protein [Yinghuangia sp. ASG 101]UGQ08877.1 PLP-dependent aminotransferase family protein [Yinghuangia sp. ASG 101]